MRIDQLLVQRGLASTRSQAQRLIASGVSWRDAGAWKAAKRNGDDVPAHAEIDLLGGAEARFVSRGGLKLDAALDHVAVSVAGAICLDIGQSTGGFTDCLLQRGAAHVVGVDVGFGQLHETLRGDPRVTCVERVNARRLGADDIRAVVPASVLPPAGKGAKELPPDSPGACDAIFDLLVGDLSFISQTLVLPAVVPLLKPGAPVLMLVKPQFELQPGQLGKGGIVTDPACFGIVEARIRSAHTALGLHVRAYFASSIDGGDGNREFFVHSVR